MRLVASMIARNECHRYLPVVLDHLAEFCDEIRVLDDASTDGTTDLIHERVGPQVRMLARGPESLFDQHEGRARQRLLDWTLEAQPDVILALDSDEVVSDGAALRKALEREPKRTTAWTLKLEEVWEVDGDCLCVREDGGWRSHANTLVWRVPDRPVSWLRIDDKALACGRVPRAVRETRHPRHLNQLSVLHFGWTNEAERQARFDRYMRIDGGRFHRSAHLDSIMWPPERIMLRGRPWPEGLGAYRERIEEVARRTPAADVS